MITVQDMFDYALEMDLSHLAHSIYWALQKDHVTFYDDSKKLQAIEFDEVEIQRMMEKNELNIGTVKLFVIDGRDDWYAFYLAEHSLDAFRLHEELFREKHRNITRADRLMIPYMTFAETGVEECLYEHRKEIIVPSVCGSRQSGRACVVYGGGGRMTQEERGVLILVICLRSNYSMRYVEQMGDDELAALYERIVAEW